MKYTCPCCGYLVFDGPPGTYDICPICFWEDDIVQLAFPELDGGANDCSLIDSQKNYIAIGVSEMRFKVNVRTPNESDVRNLDWRNLDPIRDRFLKWNSPKDKQKWQNEKSSELCLYYWLPEFWLAGRGD